MSAIFTVTFKDPDAQLSQMVRKVCANQGITSLADVRHFDDDAVIGATTELDFTDKADRDSLILKLQDIGFKVIGRHDLSTELLD